MYQGDKAQYRHFQYLWPYCAQKGKGVLSTHDKKDGWDGPCNRMEYDLTNFDPDYEFDRDSFFSNVAKIMEIKYFNRNKQFMIRLYRK